MKGFVPFGEIIGQEKAVAFLRQALERGKVPHAYLFVGIPGIGKRLTAVALAQTLNCGEIQGTEACGRCRSCRQVASGNFPDILHIEPDGEKVKIEQIRDLSRAIAFRPVSGRYRVTIIEAGERMTEEAANAFLKILEEPPSGNLLILCVSEPLDLLPTIVSRCQQVSFRPLPPALIARWLADRAEIEKEKAAVLARLSEGSLGRALEMQAKGFLEERQEHLFKLLHLEGMSGEQVLEMALEYSKGARKKTSGGGVKGEGDIAELLGVWKSWYRDLLLVKTEAPEEMLINADFSHKLKSLAKTFSIDALVGSLMALHRAERDLSRSRNLDLMMETTLLALSGFNRQGRKTGEGVPHE